MCKDNKPAIDGFLDHEQRAQRPRYFPCRRIRVDPVGATNGERVMVMPLSRASGKKQQGQMEVVGADGVPGEVPLIPISRALAITLTEMLERAAEKGGLNR